MLIWNFHFNQKKRKTQGFKFSWRCVSFAAAGLCGVTLPLHSSALGLPGQAGQSQGYRTASPPLQSLTLTPLPHQKPVHLEKLRGKRQTFIYK